MGSMGNMAGMGAAMNRLPPDVHSYMQSSNPSFVQFDPRGVQGLNAAATSEGQMAGGLNLDTGSDIADIMRPAGAGESRPFIGQQQQLQQQGMMPNPGQGVPHADNSALMNFLMR
jgi:hypothetical protein